MGTQTDAKSHVAVKAHKCSWCWQSINPKDSYLRYRYFDGGDAGTVKAHPECYEAILELAHEEGGWAEWVPGMERPITDTGSKE